MMAQVFPGWLEKVIVKTIKGKRGEPQHYVDRLFLGDGQCFLCLA